MRFDAGNRVTRSLVSNVKGLGLGLLSVPSSRRAFLCQLVIVIESLPTTVEH
jgi:hypothetical protein